MAIKRMDYISDCFELKVNIYREGVIIERILSKQVHEMLNAD